FQAEDGIRDFHSVLHHGCRLCLWKAVVGGIFPVGVSLGTEGEACCCKQNDKQQGREPCNCLRQGREPCRRWQQGRIPCSCLRQGREPCRCWPQGRIPCSCLRQGREPCRCWQQGRIPCRRQQQYSRRPHNPSYSLVQLHYQCSACKYIYLVRNIK